MPDRYSMDSGYTVDAYFRLVDDGVLRADDRVELLDGVIVAEPPMDPPQATGITMVTEALRDALGGRALLRIQAPFIAGAHSVPEPDVAVVAGRAADYADHHPGDAFLVAEVSASSLPQDRLSKSRIYAGAGIPEYWIINLPDDCLEVFRAPDAVRRVYAERLIAQRGERLSLVAFPDVSVAIDDLIPPRSVRS